MKKLIGLLCFLGFWIPPIVAVAWAVVRTNFGSPVPLTLSGLMPGFRLGVILWILHFLVALLTFSNGKPIATYMPLDSLMLSSDPYAHVDERMVAQRKAPPRELLTKKLREGIVIGRCGRNLVEIPLASGNAAHTLVSGITGSGKSSCIIIPTVMAICGFTNIGKQKAPNNTAFIFDIKKEIYGKAVIHSDPRNTVIDPDDRSSCGWDLFWELRGDKSGDIQTITDVISDICYTIIPPQPGSENAFFIDGGRDLLFGLMLYHYESGIGNFIDCVDKIAGAPMIEQVNEVLSGRPGIAYKMLARFSVIDEKAFADMSANAFNGLSLYLKDHAIRYMLRDNPNMLNPTILEDHNIFLCMEDWHLENWSQLVTMLSNQIMGYILRRPEGSHVIMCVIDEWANIQQKAGKIKSLPGFLALGRSHGGCAVLVTQSLPALEAGGTKKEEVQTMLNNIPFKVILSAGDNETQRWIISQAGKVPVTKRSHGHSGSSKNSSYSKEDKDVLDAKFLTTLPKEDRIVVLSTDYGFFSAGRAPYFKTKALMEVSSRINQLNTGSKGNE